jgi:hypothetical protein
MQARKAVFFQWFVAPEGRKVGSLKQRAGSHRARWEMKNCTPLWREAHFEAKMLKTHQCWTTFGSWDVEKVHAVVVRSAFRSQHVTNTTCSRHFCMLKHPFVWQARRNFALCQKWEKREGLVAFPKLMAGMGHLKRIYKEAFRVAGAVQ